MTLNRGYVSPDIKFICAQWSNVDETAREYGFVRSIYPEWIVSDTDFSHR